MTLISQQATLLASNEAFKKQAESASEAAKKYMEENDQLKKVILPLQLKWDAQVHSASATSLRSTVVTIRLGPV